MKNSRKNYKNLFQIHKWLSYVFPEIYVTMKILDYPQKNVRTGKQYVKYIKHLNTCNCVMDQGILPENIK